MHKLNRAMLIDPENFLIDTIFFLLFFVMASDMTTRRNLFPAISQKTPLISISYSYD